MLTVLVGSSWGVVVGNSFTLYTVPTPCAWAWERKSLADSRNTLEPSIPGASRPASGALFVIVQEHPHLGVVSPSSSKARNVADGFASLVSPWSSY